MGGGGKKELSESKYSVTNTLDHPRQQSPQHVSWPLSLRRVIWVNTSREEPGGEAPEPRLLGPENTRRFDAGRKQWLSPRMPWLLLGRARPQGRPPSGGHIWEVGPKAQGVS